MEKFVFLLKTYEKDFDCAIRLLDSFSKHNMDNIHCYVIIPESSKALFIGLLGMEVKRNCSFLAEEEFEGLVNEGLNGLSAGYINQEIVKLSFWEMGLCANYMCLDSDALFIRPFYKKDFMYDDDTPYTCLEEDNDLRADNYYNKLYWNRRMEWIRKIEDELDYHPYHLMTCHGFQIFSATVLETLKKDFMLSRNYTYKNLMEIAPYEFSWYNLWLQKTEVIPIHQIECLFKYFHLKQHHIAVVLRGMRIEDWANGYVGIIVNSNYGIGIGDYYDLSVYNRDNADIPDKVIEMNCHFYKRLRKGRIRRKILEIMRYVGWKR